MAIVVSCQCGKTLRAKDELLGKKVRCPGCGGVIAIEAESENDAEIETPKRNAPPPLPSEPAPPPLPPPIPSDSEASDVGVWMDKKGNKVSVVAVDDRAVVSGSFSKADWPRVREDIDAGCELTGVFGGQTCILLESIQKVTTDKKRCYVLINYLEGEEAKDSTFYPRDEVDQMEIFQSLRRQLGSEWQRKETEMGPLRAALYPVIGILASAVLTVVFFFAAQQAQSGDFEISGRRAGLKRLAAWLLETIGPVGVLIIGILCIAGFTGWLIAMLRNPPHLVTLKPPSG